MLVHVLYQNHKSEQYLGEMFHGKSTQEEGFKPVIVGTCCLQMPEFQPQELHPGNLLGQRATTQSSYQYVATGSKDQDD